MRKNIVITGASSGIGHAAAQDLIAQGCHVFGSVRKAADAERLQRELGAGFTPLLFDVTDTARMAEAVALLTERLGGSGLDGLVNNAGVAPSAPLMHMPIGEFRATMETNVIGLLDLTQRLLPLLGAGRRHGTPGRIVNISSVSGGVSLPLMGAYSASKYALEALSDTLRRELAIYGIHVAVVEPGPTRTPIWSKAGTPGDAPYGDTDYADAMARMAEIAAREAQHGKPVETVSAAIRHALLAPKPKARYPLAAVWHWRQLLSSGLADTLLRRQVGLKPPRRAG